MLASLVCRKNSYNQPPSLGSVMRSLFNGSFGGASPSQFYADGYAELNLLVHLEPRHRVFFGNLAYHLHFSPPKTALDLTSEPADFWPDVFVPRHLPVGALRQSVLYHAFIIVALWGLSHTVLSRPTGVSTRSPFERQTITYYSVSEYLPAITPNNEPSTRASRPRKADPHEAAQRIVSARRLPDSHLQTIVSPPKIKLQDDVPLPNLVAWTPVPSPVPAAAATHDGPQLPQAFVPSPAMPAPSVSRAPSDLAVHVPEPVQPAPSVTNAKLNMPGDLVARVPVVAPAPTLQVEVKGSNLPLPSAVEPAPSTEHLRSSLGEINIAPSNVTVAAPKLPVASQIAHGTLVSAGQPRQAATSSTGVPSAPSIQGLPAVQAGNAQAVGQLIALSAHPVAPSGAIRIPQGNRSASFVSAPDGTSGATGTPEVRGGGTVTDSAADTLRSNTLSGPPGITVEHGPSPSTGNVIVAAPRQTVHSTVGPRLVASLTHPSVRDLARTMRPSAFPDAPSAGIEHSIFGAKKSYQMTLNMPNLTSARGSWIIRFAELHATGSGELTPPVAVHKVDPSYAGELLREHVEGTVVLYAIIHADGTVGEVRILQGVDRRLDQNAMAALLKWRFRPGTKNGGAVEIEAVVRIPFAAR